ncbi:uncharacterized protein LOC121725410 isoform X2 [Aricia agestis]|uniref:uncharacterized protein LOC121725410 isoform X2 n=1 Tax=Aricia agestis TaxID=91739 RepID=UPI001C209D22|nr:uncharacterized protein LOC121725410 isoform X2 [Aricia agestis]
MVFSQTSLKTQSLLKVVEIDRLKSEKNQQVNGLSGVVTDQSTESTPPSPMATTSFSEEFIKSEQEFKSEMFHEDCEFFQDLVQWCPPVEQEALQSIDLKINEERTLNTDTQHTHFSPQGWDVLDASMSAQATYNQGYIDPLSPNIDDIINLPTNPYNTQNTYTNNKIPFQEQFLDISNLPVVIKDIASENIVNNNMDPWQTSGPDCQNTYDMNYTNHTQPFIDQDDSLDAKLVTVTPQDVEPNDFFLTEYVINEMDSGGHHTRESKERLGGGLSVNVAARSQPWPGDIISTPEVLSCVEQLEKEKCPLLSVENSPVQDVSVESTSIVNSPSVESPPFTPKSEHHIDTDEDVKIKRKRRRLTSEDSDESYTPYTEASPRKYKRRKPSIPIQDMIRVLEGSQQLPKARRGRPPKRRESTVSTVSENSSTVSTHEMKYRELRDKNNEASKRSRMNRKLKELQMEQLADELEERNKKLRVRAELLEDMTKKLREAFMSAVAQKKGS